MSIADTRRFGLPMPIALNASILLVRAAALATRAQGLAQRAPHSLQPDLAAIELQASNIRALLTSVLRQMDGVPATLPRIEQQLSGHAQRIEQIEASLRLQPDESGGPPGSPQT